MFHNSAQRLASKSARASSANLSNLPALISFSICLSQTCASNCLYHTPKSVNSARGNRVMAVFIASALIIIQIFPSCLCLCPPNNRNSSNHPLHPNSKEIHPIIRTSFHLNIPKILQRAAAIGDCAARAGKSNSLRAVAAL